jgi:putative membrane protein
MVAMMNGNWYFMGLAWIFGLVLLAVVVLLAVLVVRALVSFTRNEPLPEQPQGSMQFGGPLPRSRARQILDERLAHGHITPDDYNERLRVLGETPGP